MRSHNRGAYPHAVEEVVVCQTHISVVFLAGSCAYKIKKPVNLLLARRWEPLQSKLPVREIDSDQGEHQNLLQGLQALRDWDLWD